MQQPSNRGFLNIFARQFRRLASAFREKPAAKLDDYLLEHLMLYHGLVGTSPENQRKVRDVQADIHDALNHRSSSELGIALKLQPLWWEDKLIKIFSELRATLGDAIAVCLLPPGDELELAPESDPLRHPDWRVRANAARMLGALELFDAVPRMVAALNDDADEQKAAFCHIAYALSRLQTPQSRRALTEHLRDEEPWFRVDVAGALAAWPLADVAADLMSAMLEPHPLTDYMAVAIAKKHAPSELLALNDETAQEGALEVVIGLVAASEATFSDEALIDCGLHSCLPQVLALAEKNPTPRRLRAVEALSDWIAKNIEEIAFQDKRCDADELLAQVEAARSRFSSTHFSEPLLDWLRTNHEQLNAGSQLRHAAKMAAHYRIADATPYLVALAEPRSPALNEAIDALAALSQVEAAAHLVGLIDKTVDIEDRTTRTLSKQPVFEDNPIAAKTYWHLLRALASMPADVAVECLLKCTNDFASDKRQQALSSLVAVGQTDDMRQRFGERITARVHESLSDPSAHVRVAGLQGVGDLELAALITDVMRLTHAAETAVWRQASATLRQLHAAGYGQQVEHALSHGISAERDQFRRQRLKTLLDQVKP